MHRYLSRPRADHVTLASWLDGTPEFLHVSKNVLQRALIVTTHGFLGSPLRVDGTVTRVLVSLLKLDARIIPASAKLLRPVDLTL